MKAPGHGKELMESYSNLAYNLAGFLAYFLHGDLLVCWALQALGVGSFIYHFQKTKPIYLFDWWAMVFLVNILTGSIADNHYVWLAMIIYHVFYGYCMLQQLNSVYVQVAIAVVFCLIAIWFCMPRPIFWGTLGIYLVALWIRSKDPDAKQATFHDSYAHSFWHLLTAFGFFFAKYGHYYI